MISPLKFYNFFGLGGIFIFGILSNTSYIEAVAAWPLAKFYMHGPAYPNENPPATTLKKIVITSPTVYTVS